MPVSQLAVSPQQLELGFDAPVCQRWNHRRHSFLRTSEGGFDTARYRVRSLPAAPARAFVTTHHYSGTWPVIYRCQVISLVTAPEPDQRRKARAARRKRPLRRRVRARGAPPYGCRFPVP
ncbi:MAG: hypothetical protein JWO67_3272 [Streptosporangiaceae bacterium]|nr:hypothetical protein [Streptosporangiaceae bacterium]